MISPQPPIGTVVTTDPVTGLPLMSPDTGIIDQIPVNSDPRALQDWSAVGRPSQSLYPDDFPWVMSTTHAQNSLNPQTAQSMQTDGNHRLLVNTGSGGASGPTPLSMQWSSAASWGKNSTGELAVWDLSMYLFYGFDMAVFCNDFTLTNGEFYRFDVGLAGSDAGPDIQVATVFCQNFNAEPVGPAAYAQKTVILPGVVDMRNLFPTPSGNFILGFSSQFAGSGHATVYVGPP